MVLPVFLSIPFSLIPLLIQNIDRYSEKDLEYFLHILVYFSKLRNILGSIPSEHVFLRYLDVHTKSFYQHNFSSFEKFLNQIDIDYDSDIFATNDKAFEHTSLFKNNTPIHWLSKANKMDINTIENTFDDDIDSEDYEFELEGTPSNILSRYD